MANAEHVPNDSAAYRVPPIIEPGHNFGSITDKISAIVLTRHTPVVWFIVAGIGFLMTLMLFGAITKLLFTGIAIWGNNQPVGWAFDIINFVWWIGIGHAGTLISAILYLFRAGFRTSIYRVSEAMTVFAVMTAKTVIASDTR